MKIGIDIDGVLTDEDAFMYDYGSKFCIENHLPLSIRANEMEENIFGWEDKQVGEKFWNTYLEEYVTKYPARIFAAEVIQKLKQKHEIYIITARNEEGLPLSSYGKMKEFTEEWLKDQKISFDQILYTQRGKKLKDCVETGIDIMIDDDPTNIEELRNSIKVMCYDNRYNQKVVGKNITRVYSWYDILDKIQKMERK